MQARLLIAATFAFALGACATNDTAYRHGDGSYRDAYDDGYYAAAENGYGDYYYDRPQFVYDYGYACNGFGYGPPGWSFGARFGYDPWYGGPCGYNAWYGFGYGYYGYPWGWYRPWPRHHHDNDHDADDPPDNRAGVLIVRAFGGPDRREAPRAVFAPRFAPATPAAAPRDRAMTGFERSGRLRETRHTSDAGWRLERSEPVERRPHSHDDPRR